MMFGDHWFEMLFFCHSREFKHSGDDLCTISDARIYCPHTFLFEHRVKMLPVDVKDEDDKSKNSTKAFLKVIFFNLYFCCLSFCWCIPTSQTYCHGLISL